MSAIVAGSKRKQPDSPTSGAQEGNDDGLSDHERGHKQQRVTTVDVATGVAQGTALRATGAVTARAGVAPIRSLAPPPAAGRAGGDVYTDRSLFARRTAPDGTDLGTPYAVISETAQGTHDERKVNVVYEKHPGFRKYQNSKDTKELGKIAATPVACGPYVIKHGVTTRFGTLPDEAAKKGWPGRTFYLCCGTMPLMPKDTKKKLIRGIDGKLMRMPPMSDVVNKSVALLRYQTETIVRRMYYDPDIQSARKMAMTIEAMCAVGKARGWTEEDKGDAYTLPKYRSEPNAKGKTKLLSKDDPEVQELVLSKFMQGAGTPWKAEEESGLSDLNWTDPRATAFSVSKKVFRIRHPDKKSFELDSKYLLAIPAHEHMTNEDFDDPTKFDQCLRFSNRADCDYCPVRFLTPSGQDYILPEVDPNTGEAWLDADKEPHKRQLGSPGSIASFKIWPRAYSLKPSNGKPGIYGVKFMFCEDVQLVERRAVPSSKPVPNGFLVDGEVVNEDDIPDEELAEYELIDADNNASALATQPLQEDEEQGSDDDQPME